MQHNVKATIYDKKGRIVSVGYNSYRKTHPTQFYFATKVGHAERIYLHAEIAAILKAKHKKMYRIHVERAHNKLARPCPVCMEAIKSFGIKIVTYSGAEP